MLDFERNALGQPVGRLVESWTAPPVPVRLVLDGRYCRLEPLDATAHASQLFDAYGLDTTGESWTYMPYGPFEKPNDLIEWVKLQSSKSDPLFFAIVDACSNLAVGVASYLRITPTSGSIEVGHLQFSRRMKRTRAATEAMYLMMEHAFSLGYRRYEWKCNALNLASRTAAQRLGFSYEGLFRQATVVKGRNRDTAWFAMLDADWPQIQKAFQSWLSPENFDELGRQRIRLSDLTRACLRQLDSLPCIL